jgi:hypothetical protein
MGERHPALTADMQRCQVILLLIAVMFGLNAPQTLRLRIGLGPDYVMAVSAMKMGLFALYVSIVYICFRRQARWFAAAGAGVAALAVFGPSVQQVMEAVAIVVRGIGRFIVRLVPSTRTGWGIVGIVSSFVLLGLGTVMSLRRPPEDDEGDGLGHGAPAVPPEPEAVCEESTASSELIVPPVEHA